MSEEHPGPGETCDSGFSAGHPAPAPVVAASGGHGHDHGIGAVQTGTAKHRRRMIAALSITLGVFVVQVVGALVSNSLALLADAGHMLTDATGVTIALLASYLATLPATSQRTFGLLRVEVLAALINGIVLGVLAVVIFVTAIGRFGADASEATAEVQSVPMLIAAVIGAVANLVSLLLLRGGQHESLNVRGAYLEVLGDLIGSVLVIMAGLVILATGWNIADPIASVLIAVLIFPRAISLLRDVVNVLLEAAPAHVSVDAARTHMLAVPGVTAVHDVHAWTITSGVPAFSAHVTISDDAWDERSYHAILDELRACLRQHFDTAHITLQLEPVSHRVNDAHA